MLLPFRPPDEVRSQATDPSHGRTPGQRKIRRAAGIAVGRWLSEREPLLTDLPRPAGLHVPEAAHTAYPPRRHDVDFRAGIFAALGRVALWILATLRFAVRVLYHQLRGENTQQRRAKLLRRSFEEMGTTFIKIGQQLSMRMDLLPYAYTKALAEMFDDVAPFPAEKAISMIERASGKPLAEIFKHFDPVPIGSASVACVWQAVLCGGQRVAVKVRRPGIGSQLAADMRALRWLLKILEMFIFRPGFSRNFVDELEKSLMEELDFIREARFTDLFRHHMRKAKQFHFATSPRVYFEHTFVDVLVTEFVTGVWLTDILTAIETDNREALAKLAEMNVDPVLIGRRILLISRFGHFEDFFFHADLHPANILVQPDNRIVLIDFGSCGSFTNRELLHWRRFFDAQSLNDVASMAVACMGIIEPMPPLNKDEFALRLEAAFWEDVYAIKSKHSEWWERVSAHLWIRFLKLVREYNVPMRLNSLLMVRAIMLADTVAGRLDPDIDPYREYRRYETGAGRRARKRVFKLMRRLLSVNKYTRIQQGIESALTAVYRIERAVQSTRGLRILPMMSKAATSALLALRTTVILGLGGTVIALALLFTTYPKMTFMQVLWQKVILNGYFQLAAVFVILPALRRTFYRLRDPEYDA